MLQEVKTIDWEEFVHKYYPVKNHIDDHASYNNCMFETFGEELAYIVSLSNNEESKNHPVLSQPIEPLLLIHLVFYISEQRKEYYS